MWSLVQGIWGELGKICYDVIFGADIINNKIIIVTNGPTKGILRIQFIAKKNNFYSQTFPIRLC